MRREIKQHVRYSWLGNDLEKLQEKWSGMGFETKLYIDPIKEESDSCLRVYSPRFITPFAELSPYKGVLYLPTEEKLTPEELKAVKEFIRDYKHERDIEDLALLSALGGVVAAMGVTYLLSLLSSI